MKYREFKLRDVSEKDAEAVFQITNDPEVMKFHGTSGSFLKNIDEAKKEIEWFKNLEKENGKRWVIVREDTDGYLGDIGFFNFDKENNRVEVGFKLKKEYWNQGIVSGFLAQVVQFGFEIFKYNRIEAIVEKQNSSSKKVLEKSNFVYEGTLREYEAINGKYVDIQMYSILIKDIHLTKSSSG